MNQIPSDCLLNLFCFLPLGSLLQSQRVNRHWTSTFANASQPWWSDYYCRFYFQSSSKSLAQDKQCVETYFSKKQFNWKIQTVQRFKEFCECNPNLMMLAKKAQDGMKKGETDDLDTLVLQAKKLKTLASCLKCFPNFLVSKHQCAVMLKSSLVSHSSDVEGSQTSAVIKFVVYGATGARMEVNAKYHQDYTSGYYSQGYNDDKESTTESASLKINGEIVANASNDDNDNDDDDNNEDNAPVIRFINALYGVAKGRRKIKAGHVCERLMGTPATVSEHCKALSCQVSLSLMRRDPLTAEFDECMEQVAKEVEPVDEIVREALVRYYYNSFDIGKRTKADSLDPTKSTPIDIANHYVEKWRSLGEKQDKLIAKVKEERTREEKKKAERAAKKELDQEKQEKKEGEEEEEEKEEAAAEEEEDEEEAASIDESLIYQHDEREQEATNVSDKKRKRSAYSDEKTNANKKQRC